MDRPAVRVDEVRILEGPNLFVTRPAVKVSLTVSGYLSADDREMVALARRAGMRRASPGRAHTGQRQRFVLRLLAHLGRRLATASGIRRLTVRTRAGREHDEVVIAVPWHRRGAAQVFGEAIPQLLTAALDPSTDLEAELDRLGGALREAAPGEPATMLRPGVPVVAITGTNGKTTTTRMIAHMVMTAGLRTAWSSTDGVFVMGQQVQEGDYSGPGGAREVLSTPHLDIGILETARGGMLLKGMGVNRVDVAVITNVAADHLGLHGIDTLDQLAEVKSIPARVVKPQGWVVLNGDDPRVWPMRLVSPGSPWAVSLDPDSPALRESLERGGRGATVIDGSLAMLRPGADPDRLVRVVDVPMTMSGLSGINIANALGAAAAALALGIDRAHVVEGLRTFQPDPVHNAGRFNAYTLPLAGDDGAATVVVDMAHNEAGLEALLAVCRGLAGSTGRVLLGAGGTGDRPDEAIAGIGTIAGRDADLVVLAHKPRYVRGRTLDTIEQLLRQGLGVSGVGDVTAYPDEVTGLAALAALAQPGDVIGLMCHEQRSAVATWLAEHGANVDDHRAIRRKVVAARGEHEAEDEIADIWSLVDPSARVDAAQALLGRFPGDARVLYELGCALDAAGDRTEALDRYLEALHEGLREPQRHRAQLQAAGVYRDLGQPEIALGLIEEVSASHPSSSTVAALRGLVLLDAGHADEAVGELIDAVLDHATDDDAATYRPALRAAAALLRQRS